MYVKSNINCLIVPMKQNTMKIWPSEGLNFVMEANATSEANGFANLKETPAHNYSFS